MRKKLLFAVVLGCAIFFIFTRANPAATDTNIQAKVALETSLETRLKSVISDIIGTNKLIVIVHAVLYTEQEKSSLKEVVQKQKRESTIILPGVPAKDSFEGEKEQLPLLAPLTFSETKTSIKQINAVILLDKSVDPMTVSVVKQVAAAVLGIDPQRGDTLEVKTTAFGTAVFDWKGLLKTPDVYVVSAIILGILIFFFGAVFLFGPFRGFFANLITYLRSKEKEGGETGITAARQAFGSSPTGSLGGGPLGGGGLSFSGGRGDRPFGFVTENQMTDLIYLLKKASPDFIAVVVNYLNPALSPRVLAALDPATQSKVTQTLATVQELSKEKVKEVEDAIKAKLDYLIGGEERLKMLLSFADRTTQDRMLGEIRKVNAGLADSIKKTIFNFEDIVKLEPKIVQTLIRNINPGVFAQVLKTSPGEFQNKIFAMLPEGQAERVKQEMLLAKELSKKRVDDEKRVIVNLVKSFEQQGIVELK